MDFNTGILLIRLIVGLGIAAHGSQKLFGWFGGYGLKGTGGFFETLGFRPGPAFAFLAGCGEFGGGVLIALGFLGPVGAMLVTGTMVVAIMTVHISKGFFASNGGYEVPLIYAAAAFATAFAGPGTLSLDNALGLQAWDSAYYAWIALGLGVIGGLANLLLRRPAPAGQTSS